MSHRLSGAAGLAALLFVSAPAWAQYTVELSGNVGYTFSEGVSFPGVSLPNGNIYNSVEPKDAMSWGFSAGVMSYQHYELAFNWDRQQSQLVAGGPRGQLEISDMNVDNYHGIFAYYYGRPDMVVRPFVFGGAGATHYGEITAGNTKFSGETQFSTTWGLGLKIYPIDRPVGFRLAARWTPTYIRSNANGYWCDPYWGCYTVGDAEYSHAFELTGGVTVRFPIGQ